MPYTTAYVRGNQLCRLDPKSDPIELGTPAWYDWLEQHAAFTFVDPTGSFTVRKSLLNTGDSYWKAYCSRQGKHYLMQLGHSHALTLEKLQTAAQMFAGEPVSEKGSDESIAQTKDAVFFKHTSPPEELTGDHSKALLQTKVYQPRTGNNLISRARLLERLNAWLDGKVTLVSAPAGYGKSTLLAQWSRTLDRPTAWLSLDERDNELRVFVQSLASALQSAFPEAFSGLARLFGALRFPLPDDVVSLFISDLAHVHDYVVLVLDDYHRIHNPEIHTLIDQLVESQPPQLHLVLATRSDPPLPLARWRARGYLDDLRSSDLRFTPEETKAFLMRLLGNELAPEIAASLEEQTEGWIAALLLAALSLRNTLDQATYMERFRSYLDNSSLSTYMLEEILSQQVPIVQEFLVQASILEQFCADLCVAMLDSHTSYEQVQAILTWLEHSNVFVIPLDDRQGWYRFHHLFREVLHQRLLETCSAEELAVLHRRASAWYAMQGLVEQAIGHAIQGGDVSSAVYLVEAQFFRAFEQEQLAQMMQWLMLLPEEQIQNSPVLLVAKVWIEGAQGQLNDFPRLLTAARELLATNKSSSSDLDEDQRNLLQALIATFWSQFQFFSAGQIQKSRESALSALQRVPPGEKYAKSFALMYLAFSNQALGQEDDAIHALNTALEEHALHRSSTSRLLFALAFVYLAAGKLHLVEQTARLLLQYTQRDDLAISAAWAHWLLGVVLYEWNHLDEAVSHFSVVISQRYQAHSWTVQEAMYGLALAYEAQGLDKEAQQVTRDLLKFVQEQHSQRDLLVAYAFCGQLAFVQDGWEAAESWLAVAGEPEELAGPMTSLQVLPVTFACMLLARGSEADVVRAQALLTRLSQYARAIHSTRKTIQVLAVQAWAYQRHGREAEALIALEHALELARPGGFTRTFADLPALFPLVQKLRVRRGRQHSGKQMDTYLKRVLVAMNPQAANAVLREDTLRQGSSETLTRRELHILRLLDQRLSNKEIARELVLTTGTVKAHTCNLYRKLNVNSRSAAVSLAKALGLLVAS